MDWVVVGGIATDKLAKKEQWGMVDDAVPEGESALFKLCRATSEGRIDLSIQVRPAPTTPEERAAIGEGKVLEGEVVESDQA